MNNILNVSTSVDGVRAMGEHSEHSKSAENITRLELLINIDYLY